MVHGLELYTYEVEMDSDSMNLAHLVFQTLCDASLMVQSHKKKNLDLLSLHSEDY